MNVQNHRLRNIIPSEKFKITGMKYLMQILLGLILLQLLQSCDYSKSRDALWMKKNFENNAELFLMLLIYLITLFQ